MEIIIYESKDWSDFRRKVKEAWKEFKGAIKTIAVKVLARIIQLYIVITSDDTPMDIKYIVKLLPVGAVIIADLTIKSFPYGTILTGGAYYLYRKINKYMTDETYQEALKRAEQILDEVKDE